MKSREDHEASDWIGKALCRRYALAHFTNFHLSSLENGDPQSQTWCWALAMFSADEFEILGAWPLDTAGVARITDDLRSRGVLSIRVMSVAEPNGGFSRLSLQPRADVLRNPAPRVLEIIKAQSTSGEAVEGVPSAAIRSALDTAARIHGSLLRSLRSKAPFASSTEATEFVASWLQRADQRLYQVRRAPRPVVERAA